MGENTAVMVVMEGDEEDGKRARSFRDEDYDTRRVFLRSYPLYVEVNRKGSEDDEDDVNHLAIVVYGSTDDAEKIQEKEIKENGKEEFVKILKVKKKKINNVIKSRVYRVLRWGERKVLHINKFSKHKLSFCLVACHPFRFSKHHHHSSSSPSCLF